MDRFTQIILIVVGLIITVLVAFLISDIREERVEDLDVQAKVPAIIGERGKWLVVNLQQDGEKFFILKTFTQLYNKEQGEFFLNFYKRRNITPEQRGFTHKIIIEQDDYKAEAYFSNQNIIITEPTSRGEESNIEVLPARYITVKVPIDDVIDIQKPYQITTEELATGNVQELSYSESVSSIVGKAASIPKDDICNNLKLLPDSNNDATDPNKINFIFLSFAHPSVTDLKSDVEKMVGAYEITDENMKFSPFSFVPFKSNRDKFNFWYVNKAFPAGEITYYGETCKCFVPKSTDYKGSEFACDLNNVQIIAICPSGCTSNANLGEGIIQLGGTGNHLYAFPHELGHSFGALYDEGVQGTEDRPGYPNCADSISQAHDWWDGVFPTFNIYNGCSYVLGNWRFHEFSKMQEGAIRGSYGQVNEFQICEKIFEAYGQADGQFCEAVLVQTIQLITFEPVNFPEDCDHGLDNNNNGLVGCEDPVCDGQFADGNAFYLCEFGKEVNCKDHFDNDADSMKDCSDPDCVSIKGPYSMCCFDNYDCTENFRECDTETHWCEVANSACKLDLACTLSVCDGVKIPYQVGSQKQYARCELGKEQTCNDNFDNDADGKLDCDDEDCEAWICGAGTQIGEAHCYNQVCAEVACNDNEDNDLDGLLDCYDSDCACAEDCANLIDDNGDNLIDCADPLCSNEQYCTSDKEIICDDGINNDGDTNKKLAGSPCQEHEECYGWCSPTENICRGDFGAECSGLEGHGCDPAFECGVASDNYGSCMKLSGQSCTYHKDCYSNWCEYSGDSQLGSFCSGDKGDFCGDFHPVYGTIDRYCDPWLTCEPLPTTPYAICAENPDYVPPDYGLTDCFDTDCVGKMGPNDRKCCFTSSNCKGNAVCSVLKDCVPSDSQVVTQVEEVEFP